ncbi:MAG: hypothetical protein LBM07_03250 [Culturomica sp.]|nr:hypothetical protein [Culturomica sp.]
MLALLLSIFTVNISAQTTRFVRPQTSGNGSGSSWANASNDIQAMIDASQAGDKVFVAAGTYYAVQQGKSVTDGVGTGSVASRQRSFAMKDGVAVYGGFSGSESSPDQRVRKTNAEYGWEWANETVLSGDVPDGITDNWTIGSNGNSWVAGGYSGDNVYHVVWFAANGFTGTTTAGIPRALPLANETLLDGFTIVGGSADGDNSYVQGAMSYGGGVYLTANGVVSNCVIQKNQSQLFGGGVFMNYGGRLTDSYVGSNACSGSNAAYGYGGGVFAVGEGNVEHTFVVNNSSRKGGGVYFQKDDATVGYNLVAEGSIIANNTCEVEAGGIYCDKAGVVTACYILNNVCANSFGVNIGYSGGVYADGYMILSGSALSGNSASLNSRQLYAVNVSQSTSTQVASVQIYNSAIENYSTSMYPLADVSELINIDNNSPEYSPQFNREPLDGNDDPIDGIFVYADMFGNTYADPLSPSYYADKTFVDWNKGDCSILIKAGISQVRAPYIDLATGTQVHIPDRSISLAENLIDGREDIGPYFKRTLDINAVLIDGFRTVFVDNTSSVCGDGSSWDSPLRFIIPAMEYLSTTYGEGRVCIKEGQYYPLTSSTGSSATQYLFAMKNGVSIIGGFPSSLTGTTITDSLRNPNVHRTVFHGDISEGSYLDTNIFHLVVFDGNFTKETVLDGVNLRNTNSLGDNAGGSSVSGGAIKVLSRNVIIRNCIIENCKSVDGAAIYATQPFEMYNCVVHNNEATANAGSIIYLDFVVSDAVANWAQLLNNTFARNKASSVVRMNYAWWGNFNFIAYRNIFWGNSGAYYYNAYNGTASANGAAYLNAYDVNAIPQGQDYTNDNNTGVAIGAFTEEKNVLFFVNPTLQTGVIANGGYGTQDGNPASFQSQCVVAPFDNVNVANGNAYPIAFDMEGNSRTGDVQDLGALNRYCGDAPSAGFTQWYVSETGLDAWTVGGIVWVSVGGENIALVGGESWAAPVKLDALLESNKIQAGDEIWIAKGTNTIRRELNLPAGVKVYGGFNWETNVDNPSMTDRSYETVITFSAGLSGSLVNQSIALPDTEQVLYDKITFVGKTNNTASLVKLNGGVVMNNCVIRDNEYVNGNDIIYGAGVDMRGNNVLTNCVISGNSLRNTGTRMARGAAIFMDDGEIYNCVIADNYVTSNNVGAFTIYLAGSAKIYNSTIADNTFGTTPNETAVIKTWAADNTFRPMITNTIVYGNGSQTITNQGAGANALYVGYSLVPGSSYVGQNNNIDGNPAFNTASSDIPQKYRLTSASAALNQGVYYDNIPTTDLDGEERIVGCSVDLGAYEFNQGDEGTTIVPYTIGDTVRVYVTKQGEGTATGDSWANALCEDVLQEAINYLADVQYATKASRQVWVGVGLNYNSGGGNGKEAYFYPTEEGTLGGERSKSFRMRAGVDVIGSFAGNEATLNERLLAVGGEQRVITVLSGDLKQNGRKADFAYRVVEFAADDDFTSKPAVLRDFVITNGNANHPSVANYQHGGGVLVAQGGIVMNSNIRKCYALREGGGVYLESADDAELTDPPKVARLIGSVVDSCEAETGGGVYAGAYSFVTGSTIVANKAKRGGGLAFDWPPPLVMSTVVWGNTATSAKNVLGDMERQLPQGFTTNLPTFVNAFNYSAIEGVQASGVDNITLSSSNESQDDLSPAFLNMGDGLVVGGWSIKPTSALIDRGIHTGMLGMNDLQSLRSWYMIGETDIIGNNRVKTLSSGESGAFMDIGAYESQEAIVLEKDANNRIYVTGMARGKKDGSSWSDATSDLQAAMNYFADKSYRGEVWIQGGRTYVPVNQIDTTVLDTRNASFKLNPNVDVYGSFYGNETSLDQRQRLDYNENGIIEDFEFYYATVLSGVINIGNKNNATYHVMYYNPTSTAEQAITIDGITVIGGRATSPTTGAEINTRGGGIYATSPVIIERCVFTDNYADQDGGAAYLAGGGRVLGSSLGGNMVTNGNGGSLWMNGGWIVNTNVFNSTSQNGSGGGAFVGSATGDMNILNSIFVRNEAFHGAGLYVSGGSTVTNSLVWGNRVIGSEGYKVEGSGSGNRIFTYCGLPDDGSILGVDVTAVSNVYLNNNNEVPSGPRYVRPSATAGYLGYDRTSSWRISSRSPLVDKGNKTAWTSVAWLPANVNYTYVVQNGSYVTTPIPRVLGDNIDIGSYERTTESLATNADTMYVRTWEDDNQVSDGTSWKKATSDLQGAIESLEASASNATKVLCIARGVYIPPQIEYKGQNINAFLITKGNIKIYGGFPDDRTGISPSFTQRNVSKYETELTGNGVNLADVLLIDIPSDEVQNIVQLDGLVISYGTNSGVNVDTTDAEIIVNACMFRNNNSTSGTSTAIKAKKELNVYNSIFYKNGAAITTGSGYLANNTIVMNNAGVKFTEDSDYNTITNTVFWRNPSYQFSGISRIFTYNAVEGTLWSGTGNIKLNSTNYYSNAQTGEKGPRFRSINDVTGFGLVPDCTSPLMDAGDNNVVTGLPDNFDIVHSARINSQVGTVDIGAIESSYYGDVPPNPIVSPDSSEICQGDDVVLEVTNVSQGASVVWYSDGILKGRGANVTVHPSGSNGVTYNALMESSSGCRSNMIASYIEIDTNYAVSDLAVPASVACAGEALPFTFTPFPEAGFSYELYNDSTLLGTYTTSPISLENLTKGTYNFYLKVKYSGDENVCFSENSNLVSVEIVRGGSSSGGSGSIWLEEDEGNNPAQLICSGDYVKYVYRYDQGVNILPTTFSPPMVGLRAYVDSYALEIIIEGTPSGTFTYTISSGTGFCGSTKLEETVTAEPKPEFKITR